jgi:hypothetical protein
MANRKVALLLRAKTRDGRRYLNLASAANGKIRPLWAIYNNQPTHFPNGNYYLRYKRGKQLVFECVGSDLAVAQGVRRIEGGPGTSAELEQENAKLKQLVAELSLDKTMLQDIAAGNDLGPICGQNGGRHCHRTPLSLHAVAYFRSDGLIRSEPTCGLISDTGEPLFCVKTWAQAALARESAAASQRMRRKPKTNASSTACSIRGSPVWIAASRERCFSIDCRSGAGRAS